MKALSGPWRLFCVVLVLCIYRPADGVFLDPFHMREKRHFAEQAFRRFRQRFFTSSPSQKEDIIPISGKRLLPTQLRSKEVKMSQADILRTAGKEQWISANSITRSAYAVSGGVIYPGSSASIDVELVVSVEADSCHVSQTDYPQRKEFARPQSRYLAPKEKTSTQSIAAPIAATNDIGQVDLALPMPIVGTVPVDNSDRGIERMQPVGSLDISNLPIPTPEMPTALESGEAISDPPSAVDRAASPPESPHYAYLALFCFIFGIVCTALYERIAEAYAAWRNGRVPRYIAQLEQRTIQLLKAEEYRQVRELLQKEIPEVVRLRGEGHVDTAAFRHFHAKALLALREYQAAEALLKRVVECYESFGEDSYMAHALEDLGLAQQHSEGKGDVAVRTMEHALRIFVEEASAAVKSGVSRRLYGECAEQSSPSCSSGGSPDSSGGSASTLSSPAGSPAASMDTPLKRLSQEVDDHLHRPYSAPHSPVTALRSCGTPSHGWPTQRTGVFVVDNAARGESCAGPCAVSGKGSRERSDTGSSGDHTFTDPYLHQRPAHPLVIDAQVPAELQDGYHSDGTAEPHTPQRHHYRARALKRNASSVGSRGDATGSDPTGSGSAVSAAGTAVGTEESVVSALSDLGDVHSGDAGTDASERALRQALEELELLLLEPSSFTAGYGSHQPSAPGDLLGARGGVESAVYVESAVQRKQAGLPVCATPARLASMVEALPSQRATKSVFFTPAPRTPNSAAKVRCVVEAWYPACPHVARLLQRLAHMHSRKASAGDGGVAAVMVVLEYLTAARQVSVELYGEDSAQVATLDAEMEGERDRLECVAEATGTRKTGEAMGAVSVKPEGPADLYESPTTVVCALHESPFFTPFERR